MHQYARYFERYRHIAASRPLSELASAETIKQLVEAVNIETAEQGSNEAETERELRVRIDTLNMEIFKRTQAETTKRWTYEQEVKRPYYHVTELDEPQLVNWRRYLDFEEVEGDYARIKFLYERCLVTAANYDEFWLRYGRWQLVNDKKEEVRNIYQRASCIFVPITKPEIRLAYAAFEESLDRPDVAIAIHEAILFQLRDHVDTMMSLVNVHRRQHGVDVAIQVLNSLLADPTHSVEVRGQLVAEWGRLLSLTSKAGDTRKLYQGLQDQYVDSQHFWHGWLLFELQQPKNISRAKATFAEIRQKARVPPQYIRDLSALYLVFLKEQGGKGSMKEYVELDKEMNGPASLQSSMKRKADGDGDEAATPKRMSLENGHPSVGVN